MTARSERTIWACAEPADAETPGWKSTWTSVMGSAIARTHAPGLALARRSDRTATDGDYSRPDADAPPLAAHGHDAWSLRWVRPGVAGQRSRRAPARPGRLREDDPRHLRRRLRPARLRPDGRGGDDQVRLPVHDRGALGPPPAPLPARDALQDARSGDGSGRARAAGALRRPDLQHRRPHRAVPAGGAAADHLHP